MNKGIRAQRVILSSVLLGLGLLATGLAGAMPTDGDGGVLFSYQAPDAGQVFVAGSFNGWNASQDALANDGNGNWTIVLPLEAGRHEYKFVVDGNWLTDPDNPESVTDPYGGNNSIVTVGADGKVVAAIAPAPATTGAATATAGGPGESEEGILFTYFDPSAAQVNLAGAFNGWSDSANPMNGDGEGNWSLVMQLDPGTHEYKFVVDGSWLPDPENPETVADPYGGVNSAVTVGADGTRVAAAAPAGGAVDVRLPSAWNARVFLSGRYLSRYEFQKNKDNDPRYRLQRPYQSIDLNFDTKVSEVLDAYMRLRLDNRTSTEVNSISAELNEGAIDVHPGPMQVVGFWGQERLQLGDPLGLGGDRDLPGTIFDDHLFAGKGTSGVTVTGDPFGFHFEGFFADVFDADIYNHDFIYDNSGRDYFGARLSRDFDELGGLEIGLPMYLQRDLFDYLGDNFSKLDITAWEDYQANRTETSDFFHYEDRDYQLGLDLTKKALEDRLTASVEMLYGDRWQGIVRGNKAGDNDSDGTLDVPFLSRSRRIAHVSFDYDLGQNRWLNLEHTYINENGGDAGENMMSVYYRPERDDRVLQEEEDDKLANGRVWLWSNPAPPEVETRYTELSFTAGENRRHGLWLQHRSVDADYEPVGLTAYLDTTATMATMTTVTIAGRTGYGAPGDRWGAWDLEGALTLKDDEIFGFDGETWEFILRGERDLKPGLSLIGDLRLIRFDLDGSKVSYATRDRRNTYLNPYVGLRYRPNRKLEVVAAFGVDPMAYDIDYDGRRIGRWLARNDYREDLRFDTVYEVPGAFPGPSHYLYQDPDFYDYDAERYVAELRQIGIRAIYLF